MRKRLAEIKKIQDTSSYGSLERWERSCWSLGEAMIGLQGSYVTDTYEYRQANGQGGRISEKG